MKFFKSLCQHLSVDKDIIVKNNPDVDEYWLEEDILSQEDNDKFIDQELNLFSKYGTLFNCYIIENYTFDKLSVVLNAIFKTLSK